MNMKVFLSHSTKDKEFVQKLAQQLQAVGIEPWLCEVDVSLGDDFVEAIERGLREADVTVLIWSPDAAASPWTGKEWRSVLAREVKESRTRLGLLLLREATIPELLRTKHHIDARTNPQQSIQDVVKWLLQLRDMRQFETMGAASFIVGYEPTDFVGRTKYLEHLNTVLVEEKGKFLLWGGPGSGKSTIALKFAWRAQGAFDAVVFQHCGERPVEEISSELAERLGLDLGQLPTEKKITEIKEWLCQRRTLLVLDDIWNSDINALIPGPSHSVASLSILCTSRQRAFPWIKRPRTMEVKAFSEVEAKSLFQMWLGEETVDSFQQELEELAQRVERLPIAVAVAAEMLSRKFGPMGVEAKGLEMELLKNEIHDVPSLFQKAINSQDEQEQSLLQAMAICHPEGCWLVLAADIAVLSPTECGQVRDQLIQSSLLQIVDQNRQQFRLHALLREQIRRSLSIQELNWKRVAILKEMFSNWETQWKKCKECFLEIIPALEFLLEEGQKDSMARLANQGFLSAYRVGEWLLALRILEIEEHMWQGIGGEDSKLNIQRSYVNQAGILQAWGQLEAAMALLKKQEVLCAELGNKDSLQRSYGNQAVILKTWGQPEAAMALLKKQEALCAELGNKNSLQTSFGSQAVILKAWGQLEAAMALLKKQEALCEELGNKNSLQRSYGDQALILWAWGQLEAAMVLLKKQEALCEELGNKNSLQGSYSTQAGIFRAWGQLEAAMALLKKQEALCEELGNKDSLQTSFGTQAGIFRAWGQLEVAMALLKKQEALCEELGNKSSLGYCYWQWGLLAKKMDDVGEAKEKVEAALALFTDLMMPRERDALKKELEYLSGES